MSFILTYASQPTAWAKKIFGSADGWELQIYIYNDAHSAFGDYKDGYDIDDSDLSHYDSIDSISTDYNYEDYDPTKYVRRNSKRNSVMCD